jgi:hypothetical protein
MEGRELQGGHGGAALELTKLLCSVTDTVRACVKEAGNRRKEKRRKEKTENRRKEKKRKRNKLWKIF